VFVLGLVPFKEFVMKQLNYAGIGSRETPEEILHLMFHIGQDLGAHGWNLRSGYAGGADMAFFKGAESVDGKMEMFLPWAGFEHAPNDSRFISDEASQLHMELAEQFHPNWNACKPGAKKLHARNGSQVLGRNLDDPSDLVICWTVGGKGGGGTGQAIRLANQFGVPVFDLAIPSRFEELVAYVETLEKRNV
jgi:hypothetical protein